MEKLKIIFNQTLMISTAILFGLGIQALILFLSGGISEIVWPWYIPLSIVLGGFLCAVPTLLLLPLDYVSSEKAKVMCILHFICVGAVLTLIGYLFGWYDSVYGYVLIMIMYVIIYLFVWIATLWLTRKEEKQINEKIKELHDEE